MLTWLRKKASQAYARLLFGKGFRAFNQGRYDEAVPLLECSRHYDPEYFERGIPKYVLTEARRLTKSPESN